MLTCNTIPLRIDVHSWFTVQLLKHFALQRNLPVQQPSSTLHQRQKTANFLPKSTLSLTSSSSTKPRWGCCTCTTVGPTEPSCFVLLLLLCCCVVIVLSRHAHIRIYIFFEGGIRVLALAHAHRRLPGCGSWGYVHLFTRDCTHRPHCSDGIFVG